MAVNNFMRWSALFWVSLAANLALIGGWFFTSRNRAPQASGAAGLSQGTNTAPVKTAVVVRRQFFTWQEVESDDYPTYIKNLREISCPEQTIRDIIIADVNALYARRRALEVVTADQQWWRAEPDTNVTQEASAKIRELEQERRALLTTLLGVSWESGDLVSLPRPSRAPIPLDGPILGALPAEAKQAVEQIAIQSADRLEEYLTAQRLAGKSPDPTELSKIRQQTRRELSAILTPAQLEEYLLRYSDTARTLRSDLAALKSFNATADEFRAMFRTMDPINEQLALVDDSTAQGTIQRNALMTQADAALKLALGERRYALYQLMHDPRYREAYAEALRAGNPDSAAALYEIKLASQQEQSRINDLQGLTEEQRAVELKKAELEQLKAAAQALGQEVLGEQSRTPKPPPVKVHSVANGESLNRIAEIYRVQPSELRAANPNLNFNRLKAGDQVNVPLNLIFPFLPQPSQ